MLHSLYWPHTACSFCQEVRIRPTQNECRQTILWHNVQRHAAKCCDARDVAWKFLSGCLWSAHALWKTRMHSLVHEYQHLHFHIDHTSGWLSNAKSLQRLVAHKPHYQLLACATCGLVVSPNLSSTTILWTKSTGCNSFADGSQAFHLHAWATCKFIKFWGWPHWIATAGSAVKFQSRL